MGKPTRRCRVGIKDLTIVRKVSETEKYRNSVISLVTVKFESPEGIGFEREIVKHLGAVSVVPLLDDNRHVLVMSQFRAAMGRELIEIVAGKRDVTGEVKEKTALRELEEEIGIRCAELVDLGEFENSPGFTDEHSHSFLAKGLSLGVRNPQSIEEMESSIFSIDLNDLPKLISERVITDGKTIIGLSRARDYLSTVADIRDSLFPIVATNSSNSGDSQEFKRWFKSINNL